MRKERDERSCETGKERREAKPRDRVKEGKGLRFYLSFLFRIIKGEGRVNSLNMLSLQFKNRGSGPKPLDYKEEEFIAKLSWRDSMLT